MIELQCLNWYYSSPRESKTSLGGRDLARVKPNTLQNIAYLTDPQAQLGIARDDHLRYVEY